MSLHDAFLQCIIAILTFEDAHMFENFKDRLFRLATNGDADRLERALKPSFLSGLLGQNAKKTMIDSPEILYTAAERGNVSCVDLLLDYYDENDDIHEKAMYCAAAGGHAECVSLIAMTSGNWSKVKRLLETAGRTAASELVVNVTSGAGKRKA